MRSIDTHKIRVVLKESLPFVMVTEQFSKTRADEEKCMDVGLLCLNVTTSDPEMVSFEFGRLSKNLWHSAIAMVFLLNAELRNENNCRSC